MCGIGLIVSGIRIIRAREEPDALNPEPHGEQQRPRLRDLIVALRRRGPDSCGARVVFVENEAHPDQDSDLIRQRGDHLACWACEDWHDNNMEQLEEECFAAASLQFVGATLQLRGSCPVNQPLQDGDGNILVYNGEVFGGLEVLPGENDTEVILSRLKECCSCTSACSKKNHQSIPQLVSKVRGPWALIYWQASTRTLWFGRDAFGRKSLLVHWPSAHDPRFLLSSVAPAEGLSYDMFGYWEELPCGIYSVRLETRLSESEAPAAAFRGITTTHDCEDELMNKLVAWNRSSANIQSSGGMTGSPAAEVALGVMREAVRRRLVNTRADQNRCSSAGEEACPVAILFSGGIDSMIIAALVDRCLDPACAIDLLNVSFGGPGAPDRISAVAGVEELRVISPTRCWRLVEVDDELEAHESKMLQLICPSQTYMDSNIGTALWSAAGGQGNVYDPSSNDRRAYKSEAKVVLVGAGADEQCGGYLRYRTKFKTGGRQALADEMRLDMQRLWKRNLGRDDRCISDHGKEARFPFLDEDVIETFLDLPLDDVVDLEEGLGVGDKKILRQVARLLGLTQSSTLPKRAIQFGSGIAKKSNRKEFGSNRAANKASAGSVRFIA